MRLPWSAVGVAARVAMVPTVACHVTPDGVPCNPIPRHGMPWGCHGMPCVVPWPCREKTKKLAHRRDVELVHEFPFVFEVFFFQESDEVITFEDHAAYSSDG